MTNDSGDHIIALVVNMQLYHSLPKACSFQCNFDDTGNQIIASIIFIQFDYSLPEARSFQFANFKYKYKGGCAISTEPPTKVEWCFAKSALKVPTKSLRIFLSEFQWTPTDRDHQSITQSRLGG